MAWKLTDHDYGLSDAAKAAGLSPLLIESGRPSRPNADLIRRHAEGLARESDVMASEGEVADAIEAGIRRFCERGVDVLAAMDEWLGNTEGLMVEDVIEWREKLARSLGKPPFEHQHKENIG